MRRRPAMGEGERVLFVPEEIVAVMRAAVQQALPQEACGLLFGRGQVAERAAAIENELHSPVRFRLEPRAQLQAMQSAEDEGLELLGIYHSHPEGPAHPSATDMQEATYPQAAYLIWWMDDSRDWQCSLYRLLGVETTEAMRGYEKGTLRIVRKGEAPQV